MDPYWFWENQMEEEAELFWHGFTHPVRLIRFQLLEHDLLYNDIGFKIEKATEHDKIRRYRQELIGFYMDDFWEYRESVNNAPLFDWDRHHYVVNRLERILMNSMEVPVTRSVMKWFRKRSMEFEFLHVNPDGTCRFNDRACWDFIWDRDAQRWDELATSTQDPVIKQWYQQFAERSRHYKVAMQTEMEGGETVEYDMSCSTVSPISHLL